MAGEGDPDACDRAAADCDSAARQLDAPIQRLTSVRWSVGSAWIGTAGDSLVASTEQRRQALVQAQRQLTSAASSLRSAAAQIRAARARPRRPVAFTRPVSPPLQTSR